MNNFIFENKTKVYFGKGCVGEYLPKIAAVHGDCLLYTSPSPRDGATSRMPSSA